ncbi:MAG: 3'-5' exonuclease [Leptospiraceae bacterium]|nr:3'-5' exonuclease [Leptospiraceae bacterium]MCP5511063.1 3'-5' exonuclease [Leptospiraceae bacterium]
MNDLFTSPPLKELDFVAFDTETSGLNPLTSEVLEIAAIKFNQGGILETFSSLAKPRGGISEEASRINGITLDMLSGSPPFGEVFSKFLEFVDGSVLVIHNASFDLSFLIAESERTEKLLPDLPVICTLQLSRKVFPKLGKYSLEFLRSVFQIEKSKLRSPGAMGYHEALDDSFACMEVFRKCMSRNNGWEKPFSDVVFHPKGFSKVWDFKK